MEGEQVFLSGADAARVWRLSAQLQSEATGTAGAPAPPELAGTVEDQGAGGYPLARVRSRAREAGIDDSYVDAALADLRAWQVLPHAGRGHALAFKLLGHPPDLIVARRVIGAGTADVLAAMQAVLPGEPYRLALRDRQGDPADGGLLLFDMPGMKTPFERGFAYETNEVGLKHLLVSLRVIPGPSPACELTVHSAVTAHNAGLSVGTVAAVLGGAIGGGAFGAVGLAVAGALGLATGVAPVAALAGGLGGAALGIKGFRGIYRFAVRRARAALEGLLGAVAARAEGAW